MNEGWLKETAEGVVITVKALPHSARAGVRGVDGGALKVAVNAPPEKGKANAAVLEVLAKFLAVPRASLELLSGDSSRNKRILVKGMKAEDVRKRVGGE
jgi:uncharacterized protein (TIGR00251 family)